ncbi:MAG: alkaline phosphatase family protein [Phycisphaerales bacterium]|nr:alkaline phosphatase family protein [Phycisphaerales bacterium]
MFLSTITLLAAVFQSGPLLQGPMIGDVTSHSARIWCRTEAGETLQVKLWPPDAASAAADVTTQPSPEDEGAVTVQISDLDPGVRYAYTINGTHTPDWYLTTPPIDNPRTRIAFGSCAKEAPGSGAVWDRINTLSPDALVLLGDTPYIDSTDLEVQRRRYREWVTFPPFAALAAHTPVYSTWDDHDFGLNDTDGRLKGKANSRRAFMEHRPNPTFGEQDQGIYTSFRSGPVEVFLLDTRWFARTEGTEGNWSLLGSQQWDWLETSLRSSDAPFKILTNGMVFNNSVRPGKHDCWGAYPQEYDRLRALVDTVPGVVLVSGDVHWSRHLQHRPPTEEAPIELAEFVTSPVHEHLIPAADPPHPWLRWSRGEVNSFLLIDADEHKMRVSFMNAAGQVLHNHVLNLAPTRPE